MRCPRKIVILGKSYQVEFVKQPSPEDSTIVGTMFMRLQEIKIKPGLAHETERDTVLHEVLHAVEAEMNLSLEENAIYLMATGLLQVLRANPKFTAYLTEKV